MAVVGSYLLIINISFSKIEPRGIGIRCCTQGIKESYIDVQWIDVGGKNF